MYCRVCTLDTSIGGGGGDMRARGGDARRGAEFGAGARAASSTRCSASCSRRGTSWSPRASPPTTSTASSPAGALLASTLSLDPPSNCLRPPRFPNFSWRSRRTRSSFTCTHGGALQFGGLFWAVAHSFRGQETHNLTYQ